MFHYVDTTIKTVISSAIPISQRSIRSVRMTLRAYAIRSTTSWWQVLKKDLLPMLRLDFFFRATWTLRWCAQLRRKRVTCRTRPLLIILITARIFPCRSFFQFTKTLLSSYLSIFNKFAKNLDLFTIL